MFGFSKRSLELNEQATLFFEDYSVRDVNEELVGRKGHSLFYLHDIDVPVPQFFVLNPAIYKRFLLSAFDNKLVDMMKGVTTPDLIALERVILRAEFDEEAKNEIITAYSRLSGFSSTWVAVRSSIVAPVYPDVSFSGIFKTDLNVRGIDHLLMAIKQVYLSMFKEQVVLYCRDNSVNITDLQMAVVVQKMIQPEVAGVLYTTDPVTSDKNKISVEAVFGLGDVITDGDIRPDRYSVDKKKFNVTEKSIAPQEWMKIRKLGASSEIEQFEKIKISRSWSHQQKLEDRFIEEVSKIGVLIEDKSKKPQNIEWVYESGRIWILQNKPILAPVAPVNNPVAQMKAAEQKIENRIPRLLQQQKVANQDTAKLTEPSELLKAHAASYSDLVGQNTPAAKTSVPAAATAAAESVYDLAVEAAKNAEAQKTSSSLDRIREKLKALSARNEQKEAERKQAEAESQREKLTEMGLSAATLKPSDLEFVLTGIGSSYGEALGELRLLEEKTAKSLVITKNTILLIRSYTKDMLKYVIQSGGVVMDEGGITSDISVLCRENNIPAVVGTGLATAMLKDGEVVKIDGNVGSVYRGKPKAVRAVERVKIEVKEKQEEIVERKIEESIRQGLDLSPINLTEAQMQRANSKPVEIAEPEVLAKKNSKVENSLPYIVTATKVYVNTEHDLDMDDYRALVAPTNGVMMLDLDKIMLSKKRHPLAFVEDGTFAAYIKDVEKLVDSYADNALDKELVISIGSATVGQFRELVKGSAFESKDHFEMLSGAQRYLQNKKLLGKVLALVRRLRNVYRNRNISLAVHAPMNGVFMKEFKKEVLATGLRRNSTFKIYAVLENPAEIILASDIAAAEIDGIILNTPMLARHISGLPLTGQAKYEVDAHSVIKALESLVATLKDADTKVIVVADRSKKLLERAVDLGLFGVIVDQDFGYEAKKIISDAEARYLRMRV